MPKTKIPHSERRANLHYAVLTVPAEVRHIIGTARFVQSTKTGKDDEARLLVPAMVAGWKAQIAKARGNPNDTFWDGLRRQYIGTNDAATQFAIEAAAKDAARKMADPDEGTRLYRFATDQMGTLLAPLVADWKDSLRLTQKTIDQQHRDVQRMAAHFVNVEALEPQQVKAWTDKLIAAGATATSLERMMNGCRSLWRYLQDSDTVPMAALDPFIGSFRLATKRATRNTIDRQAFTPKELAGVYRQARDGGDTALAQLIALGAYTGARIEELCSLTLEHCARGLFTITDAKTDAGVRQVPIHPALVPMVATMKKASIDGFLVPSTAAGQYGVRSDPLSKRFGRLKESLGFGPGHVFHSIRKTVATQLEQTGVSEGIAADVLGHEKKTMSYGLYSSGSSTKQKLEALSKVIYPGALGKP